MNDLAQEALIDKIDDAITRTGCDAEDVAIVMATYLVTIAEAAPRPEKAMRELIERIREIFHGGKAGKA